jgi:hypothetical protein
MYGDKSQNEEEKKTEGPEPAEGEKSDKKDEKVEEGEVVE